MDLNLPLPAAIRYTPHPDYFNCDEGSAAYPHCGDPRLPAADTFTFCVEDANGLRSANATQRVWVMGRPDEPSVVCLSAARTVGLRRQADTPTHSVSGPASGQLGADAFESEVLMLTPLPPLRAVTPDGDWVRWEVELRAAYGVLTLK